MEELNHSISGAFANHLLGESIGDGNDIRKIKIQYAIEYIINDVEKFIVLLLIFTLSGYLCQYLLCLVSILLTRPFMGGAHMKTYIGCLICTYTYFIVSIIGAACIDTYPLCYVLFIIYAFSIIMFAPITSKNQLNYSDTKKKKLKKQGCIGILLVSVGYAIFRPRSECMIWIILLEQIEVLIIMIHRKQLKKEGWSNGSN